MLDRILQNLSWHKPTAGRVLKVVQFDGGGAMVFLGKSHPGLILTVTDDQVIVEKTQHVRGKVYKAEELFRNKDLDKLMANLTRYRDKCHDFAR